MPPDWKLKTPAARNCPELLEVILLQYSLGADVSTQSCAEFLFGSNSNTAKKRQKAIPTSTILQIQQQQQQQQQQHQQQQQQQQQQVTD